MSKKDQATTKPSVETSQGIADALEPSNIMGRFKRICDALEPSNIMGRVAGLGRKLFTRDISEEKEAKQRAKGPADPGPKPSKRPLALREVIGNATVTKNATIIWFVVPPRSDSFSPIQGIENAILTDAKAYSELIGYRCYIRSSNRPHPVASWAEKTWADAEAKARPLPGFKDYLVRQQERMADQAFNEKWVYLGVRVAGYRKHPLSAKKELAGLKEKIDSITFALAESSLRTHPASMRSMEWLLRRSIGLGLPCPEVGVASNYGTGDIEALEAHAHWTAEPFVGHLDVEGHVQGEEGTTHRKVAVLTLGRLSDQYIPQEFATGWMQRTDQLDFDVEWSAVFDIEENERTMDWLRRRTQTIDSQEEHYREHGVDVPPSLDRQRTLARDAYADLDSDHGGLASRCKGWYRVAVSAPDTQTLKQRVKAVQDVYGTKAELVLMPNQFDCAREFIPGEPLSTTAHERRMSMVSLASAIPHGSSDIGDRYGMALGGTAGSATNAAAWATHQDMEDFSRSGLCIVAGEQGAGKTFILGSIIYYEVLSGGEAYVFDPSARLGKLTRMSDMEPYSQEINLFEGSDGELNPYRVIPDPVREHFETDEKFYAAVLMAQGTRKSLMRDVLTNSLEPAYKSSKDVISVLGRALDAVPPEATSCGMDVISVLEDIARGGTTGGYEGEVLTAERRISAADCARSLKSSAQTPIGRLLFPAKDETTEQEEEKDIRLSVYTLNGMNIPDENERGDDSSGTMETQALMAVRLAAFLVQSKIYRGDPNSRKCLAIDEGKIISSFPEGKKLITKSSTDSRKHNLRFLLCSQDVTHFDFSNAESPNSLGNLVGAAIIGQTESLGAVEAALKVLHAPLGEGYEDIISGLRPREDKRAKGEEHDEREGGIDNGYIAPVKEAEKPRQVVFFDGVSTEKIVIDQSAHPALVKALDTNATGNTGRRGRRELNTEEGTAA